VFASKVSCVIFNSIGWFYVASVPTSARRGRDLLQYSDRKYLSFYFTFSFKDYSIEDGIDIRMDVVFWIELVPKATFEITFTFSTLSRVLIVEGSIANDKMQP